MREGGRARRDRMNLVGRLARAGGTRKAQCRYEVMLDPNEPLIEPEIRLRDGRVIRSLGQAIALVREHESRPGVDDRDEVLHGLERAQTDKERQAAARAFLTWVGAVDLLPAASVASPEELSGTKTPVRR